MNFHKHHIVPKWRCKELGIDPDFEDNYAYPSRHQHALIHWGYRCHDLSPLLEICNPPQYVIDMIPLGSSKDSGAAVLIAKGEIDEIDNSGENSPSYKHGIFSGKLLAEYNKYHMEGRKDKITQEMRDAYNSAARTWKRLNNEANTDYAQRERERKRHNVHRWPSTIKQKQEIEERRIRRVGTSTLEQFM